jgi:histone H3/H4
MTFLLFASDGFPNSTHAASVLVAEGHVVTKTESFWRRCSSCKREIAFQSPYWICSVSTCSRKGNTFVFCSVACWNAHVPTMRHRESWAEEQRAPSREEWSADAPSAPEPPRSATRSALGTEREGVELEVLIVASKLKQYIRARSGMNTSDSVMDVLSRRVRALCDDAIVRAQQDGRRTVMDRDF